MMVGLAALTLFSLYALRVLADFGWDPAMFVAFGEDATPTLLYGEEKLGREVVTRPALGHDGKFFFVQANDPWVIDPAENAAVLDRPLYRSQRMLYPVLAGGGGLLGPEAITWAMLIVNILAMGLGTWAVALVAVEMGGSPWWGLAFALNLGFISEMNVGGAGIVAAAAAFAAVAMLVRGRQRWGIALLALAALSREAMLITAAGSAYWLWGKQKDPRTAMAALAVPVAAVAAWAFYLRLRIGWEAGVSQVEEIGVPFVGFFQAFSDWLNHPIDLAVGVTVMVLLALYPRRVLISDHPVGWVFLGFVGLGIVFTRQVWLDYFDITRAVAPLVTAFVLLLFLGNRSGRELPDRTGARG